MILTQDDLCPSVLAELIRTEDDPVRMDVFINWLAALGFGWDHEKLDIIPDYG